MSYRVQYKKGQHIFTTPNYVQIEAHRGCTRKCDFCGIRFENSDLAMSREMYKAIVDQFNEKVKRTSYSLHGEPMLNENLPWMLSITREAIPRVQMSVVSNGDVLTRKHKSLQLLLNLFDAGLNIIQLDMYDATSYDRMIEMLRSNKEELLRREILVKNYYGAGHTLWSYHGSKFKEILICDERNGFNSGDSATRCFHTWAGNFPMAKFKKYGVDWDEYPYMKQCTEPLRYAAISANGDYLLCCSEGCKITDLGNAGEISLIEFWRSEQMHRYRFALKKGWRNIIPACYLCNKRSFRVGLYPYWGEHEYGQQELYSYFLDNQNLHDPGQTFKENIAALNNDFSKELLKSIKEL